MESEAAASGSEKESVPGLCPDSHGHEAKASGGAEALETGAGRSFAPRRPGLAPHRSCDPGTGTANANAPVSATRRRKCNSEALGTIQSN